MRLALDTSRYTDHCVGVEEVVWTLEEAEEVVLPFAVLGELRAGFAAGLRGAENERVLSRFLAKPGVRTLDPDDATTHQYAAVLRQLRQQGTPIPANDMWVAAIVLQHDLTLYSRDRHFDHLPQLRRL